MQKWEYCAISYTEVSKQQGLLVVKHPIVKRFTHDGGRIEGYSIDREGFADISQSMFKLGEEGWEMVGCSDAESYHIVYFKRPME